MYLLFSAVIIKFVCVGIYIRGYKEQIDLGRIAANENSGLY
jgi:hypothetical protein